MKIGDIVRFNAGGPPMNVIGVSTASDGTLMITVLWVITGDVSYSTALVPAACLKPATGI